MNSFKHMELTTGDLDAAQTFYGKLFAWKLTSMEEMPFYVMIDTGSKEVGGAMKAKQKRNEPAGWIPYVTVKDVRATLEKAEKLGAKITLPYHPIPGRGAMGVFVDPGGVTVGVWEP